MNRFRKNIIGLAFGAMFGGVLAAGSLHEYDTIHNMLKLDEFYVFGFMGSAIFIATIGPVSYTHLTLPTKRIV